jgi:hypothetical protein
MFGVCKSVRCRTQRRTHRYAQVEQSESPASFYQRHNRWIGFHYARRSSGKHFHPDLLCAIACLLGFGHHHRDRSQLQRNQGHHRFHSIRLHRGGRHGHHDFFHSFDGHRLLCTAGSEDARLYRRTDFDSRSAHSAGRLERNRHPHRCRLAGDPRPWTSKPAI